MLKMRLKCLYENNEEKSWFKDQLQSLKTLFSIQIEKYEDLQEWEPLTIILSFKKVSSTSPSLLIGDRKSVEELVLPLLKLQQQCMNQLLEALPFNVTLSDNNGLLVTNSHPREFSFFEETLEESYQVPEWIKSSLNGEVHQTVISPLNDVIPIHSYYQLEPNKRINLEIVEDIKPKIATYLKESAQAIVPWSDTISGASISSDLTDELLDD